MTLLDAHAQFAAMYDRGDNLEQYSIATMPESPLLATGLASLSGQLDDATDETALLAALAHGRSLFDAGVLSEEQWQAEVDVVFRALDAQCGPTCASEHN